MNQQNCIAIVLLKKAITNKQEKQNNKKYSELLKKTMFTAYKRIEKEKLKGKIIDYKI